MGGRPVRRLSAPLPPPDCETLIRRMLVVEPAKRITIAQIRQHRWMQAEPALLLTLTVCPLVRSYMKASALAGKPLLALPMAALQASEREGSADFAFW